MTPRAPSDSHAHAHGFSADADERYIAAALSLILTFMIAEVMLALVGHSLSLLADAGHMLTDVGALAASLVAGRLARKPAAGVWTFGFKRAEVLSAQANGITLLVVGALVAYESIRRLINPPAVTGVVVLVVAAVGVVVNLVATWVLAKANRDSINIKGSLQHLLTDLYAFIGTLIAGVVIVTTGYARADSIASLVVVALMLRAAFGLLSETGRILLEAAPKGINPAEIVTSMTSVPHVASVHDVHIWLITSGFPALSAHVLVDAPADCHGVRKDLEEMLSNRFGLTHTTLQVEHVHGQLLKIGTNP